MAAALPLRSDHSADDLGRIARDSVDADQTRRLLALAVILDGGSRSDAARTGRFGLQVIRDWVLRFNEGGPDALATHKVPGKTPILTDVQRARLAAAVEPGPRTGLRSNISPLNCMRRHLRAVAAGRPAPLAPPPREGAASRPGSIVAGAGPRGLRWVKARAHPAP